MFVDADEVGNIENALAIVVNGNTAPKAISSGQYLFIKNHSTLATGGYHATANIANGGNVTSSNTTPDTDGISNGIKQQIDDCASYDVLQSASIDSTTETTVSIISGKKFSDYRYLWLLVDDNVGAKRASFFIPRPVFAVSTTNAWQLPFYYAGTLYTVVVKYVSDTQFSVRITSTISGATIYIKVYGICKY